MGEVLLAPTGPDNGCEGNCPAHTLRVQGKGATARFRDAAAGSIMGSAVSGDNAGDSMV